MGIDINFINSFGLWFPPEQVLFMLWSLLLTFHIHYSIQCLRILFLEWEPHISGFLPLKFLIFAQLKAKSPKSQNREIKVRIKVSQIRNGMAQLKQPTNQPKPNPHTGIISQGIRVYLNSGKRPIVSTTPQRLLKN